MWLRIKNKILLLVFLNAYLLHRKQVIFSLSSSKASVFPPAGMWHRKKLTKQTRLLHVCVLVLVWWG